MIIEKWKQSHTYVRGKDHIKLNIVCQDRTYYAKNEGVHVIALADGAGSKKISEIGAEIVTKTICELLVKNFFKFYMGFERRGKDEQQYHQGIKSLKKQILNALLDELYDYAKTHNIPLEELSSTLLFCALYKGKYIMGHIGDGVIGGLFEEDNIFSIRALSEPRNGGAPNITFFVTDNDALDNLRMESGEFRNLRGLVLMSDGPAEVMYHKNNGLNDNVIKIFENFNQKQPVEYNDILYHFLNEKISTFSSDDLSLNVLYLESLDTCDNNPYILDLLIDITAKDQIIFKSQYCVELDPTLKARNNDFYSLDDVRRFIKWT